MIFITVYQVQSALNMTTLVANQTDLVAILDGTCSVTSRKIFDITKLLSSVHVSLFVVCYYN